jgi:RNA polymerase sigma factor (sigma-70 family)
MGRGRFATTSWSLVLAAGRDSSRGRRALEDLCRAYWYPLYAFVRRQGYDADDAADLTQGYFAALLGKEFLAQVSPAAGKFRSFLIASIKHFLSNQRDRDRALKRGGGRPPIELDAASAEERYAIEPPDGLTPEKLFERRWASAVLERAMKRLRSAVERSGDARRFDRLRPYLIGEDSSAPYRDVAQELGMTESALAVAVHRLRKQFGQALRDEIAETVAEPREIDDEIRYLLSALGS